MNKYQLVTVIMVGSMCFGFADCGGRTYSTIYKIKNCSSARVVKLPESGQDGNFQFLLPDKKFNNYRDNLSCENLKHYQFKEKRSPGGLIKDPNMEYAISEMYVGILKDDKCSLFVATFNVGKFKLTDAGENIVKGRFNHFVAMLAKEGKFETELNDTKLVIHDEIGDVKNECSSLAQVE